VTYDYSPTALAVFASFVALTLGLSYYFARRTKTSSGYYAAGGQIHWVVNGVAFAGDYLSAASFLGICGMIAFYGYDGFLYSIGYLACTISWTNVPPPVSMFMNKLPCTKE
jgi:cation/acetate symporter